MTAKSVCSVSYLDISDCGSWQTVDHDNRAWWGGGSLLLPLISQGCHEAPELGAELHCYVMLMSRGHLCHYSHSLLQGRVVSRAGTEATTADWSDYSSRAAANTYGTVELTQAAHARGGAVTHSLPGERQQT